jgi:hypothetical protein
MCSEVMKLENYRDGTMHQFLADKQKPLLMHQNLLSPREVEAPASASTDPFVFGIFVKRENILWNSGGGLWTGGLEKGSKNENESPWCVWFQFNDV